MSWRDELAANGYAVLPSIGRDPDEPWSFFETLWGARPRMIERQPIRPSPGARSFAGSDVFTPFHTDSQDYLGESPALQIMVCRRAASRGGETRLVDGRALLAALAPALHAALFRTERRHRFYFGDVIGPTVREHHGHIVWTHSPMPPADPIGEALALELARAPVIELAVKTGETLVIDNHRMLHGRNAFEDPARDFVRLLAWLTPRAARSDARLAVVIELLTGTPPARLAAREGITEAELYAWRTRALAAASSALAD